MGWRDWEVEVTKALKNNDPTALRSLFEKARVKKVMEGLPLIYATTECWDYLIRIASDIRNETCFEFLCRSVSKYQWEK